MIKLKSFWLRFKYYIISFISVFLVFSLYLVLDRRKRGEMEVWSKKIYNWSVLEKSDIVKEVATIQKTRYEENTEKVKEIDEKIDQIDSRIEEIKSNGVAHGDLRGLNEVFKSFL